MQLASLLCDNVVFSFTDITHSVSLSHLPASHCCSLPVTQDTTAQLASLQ